MKMEEEEKNDVLDITKDRPRQDTDPMRSRDESCCHPHILRVVLACNANPPEVLSV